MADHQNRANLVWKKKKLKKVVLADKIEKMDRARCSKKFGDDFDQSTSVETVSEDREERVYGLVAARYINFKCH